MTADFKLEVLVDFLDDALLADHVLGPSDIDSIMRTLARLGVKRVSWSYYRDKHGGWRMPDALRDGQADYGQCRETYRALGHPLRQAVESGHRHGLEVYAYFKPYETGVSMVIPDGSPEAAAFGLLDHRGGKLGVLDPFVRDHASLRLQRRHDRTEADGPICSLRLAKRDAGPTRLNAARLQIWTSDSNFRYKPYDGPFEASESVEPAPRDVFDHAGAIVTRKGDPVRVLRLSGFRIQAPYILVTTDCTDGPADFWNSGTAMLAAFDSRDREIPGEIATGAGCWLASKVNFRDWGLIFDYGWGAAITALDVSNADGRSGLVAFARGQNEFLPAALCETEPSVQAFWLDTLRDIIAAGVDGVDFREENHCTHTNDPGSYGYNGVVLDRCRPGVDPLAEISRVRGEAYTDFLRQAKTLLAASQVRLRYHLNMDWFRPDPPAARALAYPANIRFDWQTWIAEGLLDEAVLRSYHHRTAMLNDPFGRTLTDACRKTGIPVSFNHHVFDNQPWYKEEADRVAADGRFSGLILYELANFMKTDPSGACRVTLPVIESICASK